jgi:hypothetical protein
LMLFIFFSFMTFLESWKFLTSRQRRIYNRERVCALDVIHM